MRRLPMQGALRRAREQQAAKRIAAHLSRLLTADVTTVCVAQSLLPYLWRQGRLAGRDVRVLMTRLPMAELQARLDHAATLHPESATLRDFRAPFWLVEAEAEALAYASAVVTPHRGIARLFRDKLVQLDWRLPPPSTRQRPTTPSRRIAFPGPTVARKGAYELREAARTLDLEIVCVGHELEGAGFWNGVKTVPPAPDWLSDVAAVVQPAVVEDNPRRLLAALAAGVPVIATAACGLPPHPLATIVPEGDAPALVAALRPLQSS